MKNNFYNAQEILYNKLAYENINCYGITEHCKSVEISRATFYKKYPRMSNFMAVCVCYRLKKDVKRKANQNFTSIFYNLLLNIKTDKIYYSNIFQIAKKDCICETLRYNLYELIKDYVEKKGCYADPTLRTISNHIYDKLYKWIAHDCKENINCVINDLDVMLVYIEKQKDFFAYSHLMSMHMFTLTHDKHADN